MLELPAGAFDPNQEDSKIAAARELEEETGYIAPNLIKLATLYDKPVKDTNKIHIYLAQNASLEGEQKLDITEEIEIVLIPITEVKKQICTENICVAETIAALFLGLDYLDSKEYNSDKHKKNHPDLYPRISAYICGQYFLIKTPKPKHNHKKIIPILSASNRSTSADNISQTFLRECNSVQKSNKIKAIANPPAVAKISNTSA